MRKQQAVRLAAVLLPLFAYGGSAAALIGGGALRYMPGLFVVVFSLLYTFGPWIDDTKIGKELYAIGHSASTNYVKFLVVLGAMLFCLALTPFAILRFSVRLAGHTAVNHQANATA